MYSNRITVEDVQWQEAKSDMERTRMQYEMPARVLIVMSAVGLIICLWLGEERRLIRDQCFVASSLFGGGSIFYLGTLHILRTTIPPPEISFGSQAGATGVLSDLANKSIIDILERYGNNLDKLLNYKFITADEYTILRAMREKESTIKYYFSSMKDTNKTPGMRDWYKELYDEKIKDFVDFQERVVRRGPILPPEYQ